MIQPNIEAEKAVLGIALTEGKSILNEIRDQLNIDDFSNVNAHLFQILCELADGGIDYDMVLLADKFKNHHIINLPFLMTLANSAPIYTNLQQYVDIVKRVSITRKKDTLLREQLRKLEEGVDPIEIISSGMIADMDLIKDNNRDRIKHISEVVRDTYKEIELKMDRDFIGIPTGISPLDKVIGGLIEDCVITLAARPSRGKTTLAQQICLNVTKEYFGAVCSLEMSYKRLGIKFIANESKTNSRLIDAPKKLKDLELTKISHSMGSLSNRNLFVDDSQDMKASQIAVRARKLKAKHDIKFLIVDYIQIVHPEPHVVKESKRVQIEVSMQILKNLARELGITVIVISQMNREIEKRADKKPTLADLHESGALEAMSDIILFLYSDEESEKKTAQMNREDWSVTPLNVAKNKYGPQDVTIDLLFMKDQSAFTSIDYGQGHESPKKQYQ